MNRSSMFVSLASAVLAAGPLSAQTPTRRPADLTVVRVEDSVVVLSDGTRWQPGLYAIELLAKLPVPLGRPYFVFGAYSCNECDAGPDLWILRARDSVSAAAAVMYPGTHVELGQDRPYGESRVFVGRCLPGGAPSLVAVWHSDTLPATPDSVYTIIADRLPPTRLAEPRTTRSVPTLLRAVAARTCRELKRAAQTP